MKHFLSDILIYLSKTLQGLEKLEDPDRCNWCQEEEFARLKTLAKDEALSMPPSANLRSSNQFDFNSFIENTYLPFIERFTSEINDAFEQLDFWLCFVIFDPRKPPKNTEDFNEYGICEIDNLAEWYGEAKTDRMNSEVSQQPADIDPVKLKLEWQGFLAVISERRKSYEHKIDVKLLRAKTKEEREYLQTKRQQYTPSKFWNDTYQDAVICDLYPQYMYLLELSIMFPLSVSCVERLFSRMKLVKTRLRNQFTQVSLESILRISTESPSNISDEVYKFFDELKRLNPKLKINI